MSDYRERLVRFYEKYAPEKVAAVDATLATYAGKEEAMFKALERKYGPETGAQHARPEAGGVDHRARLVRFYEKYAPEKVGAVDATLTTYAGKEEAMFKALERKYGPEPQASSAPQPAATSNGNGGYKDRLTRFYEKYAPEKVSAVDATLATYAGKEEAMFKALERKYGPEPSGQQPTTPSASSPPSGEQRASPAAGDYKTRLVRFYEKYAPEKVGAVDATLTTYAGKEEAMFKALERKYGPEPGGQQDQPSSPSMATSAHTSSKPDYRARLVRFYEHHAPEKVAGVDATLKTYDGKEEAMFAALVRKYGPEPAEVVTAAPGVMVKYGDDINSYGNRLQRFLAKYSPADVPKVPALLEKYKGKEDAMMGAFIKKFGSEPPPERPPIAGVPPEVAELPIKSQLTLLINHYDPANAALIDGMLEKYAGREFDLRDALVKKYGPIPIPPQFANQFGGVSAAAPTVAYSEQQQQQQSSRGSAQPSVTNQQQPVSISAHVVAPSSATNLMVNLVSHKQFMTPEQALASIIGSKGVARWQLLFAKAAGTREDGTTPVIDPATLAPLEKDSLCRLALVFETTAPGHLEVAIPPPPLESDVMQAIALAPTLPGHFTDERIAAEILQSYPGHLLASGPPQQQQGGANGPSLADIAAFRTAYRIAALYAQYKASMERDFMSLVERDNALITEMWAADRARIAAIEESRRQRVALVYSHAMALLYPIEEDQRTEITRVEKLYRGGLLRWHSDKMVEIVMSTPPADIRRLERKFDDWKRLVMGASAVGASPLGKEYSATVKENKPIFGSSTQLLTSPRDAAELSEHKKFFQDLGSLSPSQTYQHGLGSPFSTARSGRQSAPSVRSLMHGAARINASINSPEGRSAAGKGSASFQSPSRVGSKLMPQSDYYAYKSANRYGQMARDMIKTPQTLRDIVKSRGETK